MLKKTREMCASLLKIFIKMCGNHKNSEIVDFLMLIISCLFPYRVGTYRQVLHLFIKTITVCGKQLKTKVYCNIYYYYRFEVLA